MVGTGRTEHAEAVSIVYDPSQISYGQLLKVFFSVAHDPTELNRQGPDQGPQYRVRYSSLRTRSRSALPRHTSLRSTGSGDIPGEPLRTQVVPLKAFYKAEGYHQDYVVHNPDQRYIVINDLPKLDNLRKQFPELYVGK